MKGRRRVPLILSILVALGSAGWLAYRHAPSADPQPLGAAPFPAPHQARESPANRSHHATASSQPSLAQRILAASEGRGGNLPDLGNLRADDLQNLLNDLQPDLAGQPAARQVFCDQMVLSALQERDPDAALLALERLNQSLPEDTRPGVWIQLAEILFSSVPPSGLATTASWLKDHQALFPAESAYQEMSGILAMSASHQDLDTAFSTVEELGLSKETILPALARQTDSPEDWTRILAELHASGSATTTGPGAEVLIAANARIGQMSAEDGMAWLASVPLSQQDLQSILIDIEAGPIQDPQPWLAWMQSRLTPQQFAKVRSEWSKRTPATASLQSN